MSKMIMEFPHAVMREVTALNEALEKSNWRKAYIGKYGCLRIMESEHRHPGERFIDIKYEGVDCEGELRTTCGQIQLNDSKLTIITKNSRYVFEVFQ